MANTERRKPMALDDAYNYCRRLESGAEQPELYQLLSAIRTVDAALDASGDEPGHWPQKISLRAWSQVRSVLYNSLISSFPGYFVVYGSDGAEPLEAGSHWPDCGYVEFYPEQTRRREDGFRSDLSDLDEEKITALRWCFAEGRQLIKPSDFPQKEPVPDAEAAYAGEAAEAAQLLDRLYDVCIEEAMRGKKRAHERWWRLFWEANSCPDREEKRRLRKEMTRLQSVWGRPS